MSIKIDVNNKPISCQQGETLLSALRSNGFRIPTLCHMAEYTPSGACRLCVVEVEGKKELITSCTYPVEEGLKVKTNSARVIKARKTIVEMLLANHPDDCLYCERNGNCELQHMAEEMHVKERRYFSPKNADQRDHTSPSVYRDPAKCILCNRCIRVCEELQLVTAIEFISRGNNTRVNSAFNKGLNVSSCIDCGQCIIVCPTGALVDISHIEKVQSAVFNPKKITVASISAGFVASISEHFNIKPSDDPEGLIISAIRRMGFDRVFSMNIANDLNLVLEASQLLQRLEKGQNLPLLSSCCPAWVEYAEEFTPEILSNISTVKSPQQLMGSLIKYEILGKEPVDQLYTVSFVPCTANKFEALREENTRKGISETDAVITVREFLRMLRSNGINIFHISPEKPDELYLETSNSGYQMGYSGGKAEAIAHQFNLLVNGMNNKGFKFTPPKNPGSRKEVKVKIGKREVGFAWVSGIAEVQRYLDQLKLEGRNDIHFIEVMACPGGCAGGGGQPILMYADHTKNRKKICQDLEKSCPIAVAGHNNDIAGYVAKASQPEEAQAFYTAYHKRDVYK